MEGVSSGSDDAEVSQALLLISVGLTLSPTYISGCLTQCTVSELVLIKRA